MLKKNKIKIYISLNLNQRLKGGGFNFLNFLNYKFNLKNQIVLKPSLSDVILINSHHFFIKNFLLKLFYPEKIFIHRIDGPISMYVGKKDFRDNLVMLLNKYIADATIFQSKWSYKNKNFPTTKRYKIIHNSADTRFYKYKKKKKIKNSIVINSWSNNINKGFKYYSFLDQKLNFNKFRVSFVGNSPLDYKNIKVYKPMSAKKLSTFMSKHQIYLTASKNDPCSNSLIEALTLKLPAVALKSGGHKELIMDNGVNFTNYKDLINKINFVFKKYNFFFKKLSRDKKDSFEEYNSYIKSIFKMLKNKKFLIKKINLLVFIKIFILYLIYKINRKI